LITGLLLYFLFWPTFAPLDMAGRGSSPASWRVSSKYALAFRGRHIFNPAAAGAFITGLTGLNIATWWAATPAMLWLLVPGVFIVLYRTRKLLMATTVPRGGYRHHHHGAAEPRHDVRTSTVAVLWRSVPCCFSWVSCSRSRSPCLPAAGSSWRLPPSWVLFSRFPITSVSLPTPRNWHCCWATSLPSSWASAEASS
jgi:hypothetical protein